MFDCFDLYFALDGKQRFVSFTPTFKWMPMYPGTGQILVCFFFSFSCELGNFFVKSQSGKGWQNSGISTNEDFSHV